MEYLGSVDKLSEAHLAEASGKAQQEGLVFQALTDILQRHTNKPEEEVPQQPVSEPQGAPGPYGDAGGASIVDKVLSSMLD